MHEDTSRKDQHSLVKQRGHLEQPSSNTFKVLHAANSPVIPQHTFTFGAFWGLASYYHIIPRGHLKARSKHGDLSLVLKSLSLVSAQSKLVKRASGLFAQEVSSRRIGLSTKRLHANSTQFPKNPDLCWPSSAAILCSFSLMMDSPKHGSVCIVHHK